MTTPILEARDLSKRFPGPKKLLTPARFVTAVDRVSLSVMPGETLAIVGESGSGKSTLGRLLLRLLAASEGRVFYQGEEITHASGAGLNQLRRELQIIFQDPFASLNPRMTVEQIVGEPLWLHQEMKKPIVTIALRNCLKPWVCLPPGRRVFRTSFQVGNASALVLRVRWPPGQNCCWVTSPSRRWMFPCRRR